MAEQHGLKVALVDAMTLGCALNPEPWTLNPEPNPQRRTTMRTAKATLGPHTTLMDTSARSVLLKTDAKLYQLQVFFFFITLKPRVE